METDFDTFDPNEALVDEGRNRYYPAGWQKGDPVFVLNEQDVADYVGEPTMYDDDEPEVLDIGQRKVIDCE